ncbi:MAG: hypothetical protein Q9195_004673 [Heterodermia aff. obscurata]
MGKSLTEYLKTKVHPLLQERSWDKILVIGDHQRDSSKVIVASNEKGEKLFNWMRPTVSVVDPSTLYLHVFPGRAYVEHYASIIATYLAFEGKEVSSVKFKCPSQEDCLNVFSRSNLARLGAVDIVVLGYVQGLESLSQGAWEDMSDENMFSWKTVVTAQGYRVALLGCRICFWGDIGGNLVRTLQRLNGAKCVLYVGKLGSLQPDHVPNRTLATGNQSFVRGELIAWQNPLEQYLQHAASVVIGVHTCLPSVLYETHDWLVSNQDQVEFVDPEIGQMAKASLEVGCQFGYLHIVSDNLARNYDRDLSNERLEDVRRDRVGLLSEIQAVLEPFFNGWTSPVPNLGKSSA